MRHLLLAALLLAALPAQAQRLQAERPGPHDGTYQGHRFQECNRGGRIARERLTAEIRQNRISIPALPGDPPLEAAIAPDGKVELPPFGLFHAGAGQIFEGPNNARRFTGTHPGRGDCRVSYDLLRQR